MVRKPHKYGAKKTIIDGITFDSKMEARYYLGLKLRAKAGEIEIISLQPKVYLTEAKILYKPDFFIWEKGVGNIYIDVKGPTTPVFKIKMRLWKKYGPGILRVVYKNKIDEVKNE